MAGVRPREPATRRVRQGGNGTGTGQVVQHLWFHTQRLAQLCHCHRHHRDAHPVHHPGTRNRVGAGLHGTHLCPLPRRHVGFRAVCRADGCGLFCHRAQVRCNYLHGHPAGHGHRLHHGDDTHRGHAAGVLPIMDSGAQRAAGLPGGGSDGRSADAGRRPHQRLRLLPAGHHPVAALPAVGNAA